MKGASILVFSLPGQFLEEVLDEIKGSHRAYARGVACVKGKGGDVSDGMVEMIMEKLQIYCGTLSGTNAAGEVAREEVCEATIGYDTPPVDMPEDTEGEKEEEDGIKEGDEHRQTNTKPTLIHLTPAPKDYPPLDTFLLRKLFEKPYFKVHTIPDAAGVPHPSAAP